jgi:hypothetical protein
VIREDKERCSKRTENIMYGMRLATNLPQTVLNCNGAAESLNVNCFIRVKNKERTIYVL